MAIISQQTIDPQLKLSVDKLKSLLLQRRVTRDLFKLPITKEQTKAFLQAALAAEVEYRHGTFLFSPVEAGYIERVAEWLTSDSRKFGLILCGKCGNGKTTLMRAICSTINYFDLRNDYGEQLSIRVRSAKDIAHLNKDSYADYKKVCMSPMLAIDDLGFEPAEVLDYGNILNPLIDLLELRYTEQLFTLITTNLTPDQIRERYGDRIADRFNEMMNKIVFTNESFRKM